MNLTLFLTSLYNEVTRTAEQDDIERAEFLYSAAEVLDTYRDDLHLVSENREHTISEHIANRFQRAALVPGLIAEFVRLYPDVTPLSAEVFEALEAADKHLTVSNNNFKNQIVSNGGGMRVVRQ
jgi:hypothetical protein